MDSVQVTDQQSEAVATHPRVKLADIEARISCEYSFTAGDAVSRQGLPAVDDLNVLTICILVMDNGFTVIGKSAPASPENFDKDLGEKFAREDAIRQLWPLMGFELRSQQMKPKA